MNKSKHYKSKHYKSKHYKKKNKNKNKNNGSSAEKKPKKVVIVGAGFAGLSVAYHLVQHQQQQQQQEQEQNVVVDIEIVEARDRIGGRVYPFELDADADADDIGGNSNGNSTMVDLGGQWIHEASRKNPIRQLMEQQLGLGFHQPMIDNDDSDNDNDNDNNKNNEKQRYRYNVVVDAWTGKEVGRGVFQAAKRLYHKALNEYQIEKVDIHTSFQELLDQTLELQKLSDDRVEKLLLVLDDNDDDDNDDDDDDDDDNDDNDNGDLVFQSTLNYLRHRTECYEGGRLFELNAGALSELYQNKGGPDKIPHGGSYHALLAAIANTIGMEKIRLDCPVKSIEYCTTTGNTTTTTNSTTNPNEKVKLTLAKQNDKDQNEVVLADHCVCTVPLGVLQERQINFTPNLTDTRWKAIDAIGMGYLDKVVLKFEHIFWKDSNDGGNIDDDDKVNKVKDKDKDDTVIWKQFGVAHPDASMAKTFYDCSSAVGAPVLMLFVGGDAARRMNRLTDEEAVQDAMASLRMIFGGRGGRKTTNTNTNTTTTTTIINIPDPIASKVTRWTHDVHARGAYSFAKVGCTESAYDEVAQPAASSGGGGGGGGWGKNRLLFAGEHTSKHSHSTVHGAWETGQREANRLLRTWGLADAE